jgi:hypothetical protein
LQVKAWVEWATYEAPGAEVPVSALCNAYNIAHGAIANTHEMLWALKMGGFRCAGRGHTSALLDRALMEPDPLALPLPGEAGGGGAGGVGTMNLGGEGDGEGEGEYGDDGEPLMAGPVADGGPGAPYESLAGMLAGPNAPPAAAAGIAGVGGGSAGGGGVGGITRTPVAATAAGLGPTLLYRDRHGVSSLLVPHGQAQAQAQGQAPSGAASAGTTAASAGGPQPQLFTPEQVKAWIERATTESPGAGVPTALLLSAYNQAHGSRIDASHFAWALKMGGFRCTGRDYTGTLLGRTIGDLSVPQGGGPSPGILALLTPAPGTFPASAASGGAGTAAVGGGASSSSAGAARGSAEDGAGKPSSLVGLLPPDYGSSDAMAGTLSAMAAAAVAAAAAAPTPRVTPAQVKAWVESNTLASAKDSITLKDLCDAFNSGLPPGGVGVAVGPGVMQSCLVAAGYTVAQPAFRRQGLLRAKLMGRLLKEGATGAFVTGNGTNKPGTSASADDTTADAPVPEAEPAPAPSPAPHANGSGPVSAAGAGAAANGSAGHAPAPAPALASASGRPSAAATTSLAGKKRAAPEPHDSEDTSAVV